MALKTRTRETPASVGGDARIEEQLDKRGVKFTFLDSVPPAAFDAEDSLANNARFEAIDKARVEQYAEDMKRGDNFPPVVAHKKGERYSIVDGNHRLQGAIVAKKSLGVYDITGAPPEVIVMLSFEANAHHGLPTSEAEKISQALWLINNGATIPDAAQLVSLPVRTVTKASKDQSTDQRFIDCNVPQATIERLGSAVRWRLSHIQTNAGFLAAIDLAERAKWNADDTFAAVTEINKRRDSDEQVQFIKEVLEPQYFDTISGSGGGVLGKRGGPTPKGRISMALSGIDAIPDNLETVVSQYLGPERDAAAKRMRAAAKRLNELARALSA